MAPIDLRNPSRPIHVGVILLNRYAAHSHFPLPSPWQTVGTQTDRRKSVTELLDIAPFGFFSGISRSFLKDMPPIACPDEIKSQVPEFVFHWVTETGDATAKLTGGMNVVPTVCPLPSAKVR
jgi:hypothetical protein